MFVNMYSVHKELHVLFFFLQLPLLEQDQTVNQTLGA